MPKFRLALEGGGARLFAHIAALEAVRDAGLEVSVVAGVSAGAVAAVLFGAGITAEDIKKVLERDDFETLFANPFSKNVFGRCWTLLKVLFSIPFIKESELRRLFKTLLQEKIALPQVCFRDLKHTTLAISTNIISRDDQVFGKEARDDVVNAMISSANLPFIFYGHKRIGPNHFLDGGLFSNVPVDHLREYEVTHTETADDPIIAFLFPDSPAAGPPSNLLEFFSYLIDTSISAPSRVLKRTPRENVYVVHVDSGSIGTFDFDKARAILVGGKDGRQFDDVYQNVKRRLDEILKETRERETIQYQEVRRAERTAQRVYKDFPPRYTTPGTQRRYACLKVPYTDIPQVKVLQERLCELSRRVLGSEFVQERTPLHPHHHRRFDAFKRPEIAISNEAIYSFPFFLSPIRRSAWGVIPYAWQRGLGVAVPSHFEITHELEALNNTEDDFSKLSDHGQAYWLEVLFDYADKVNGKVYSIDGYLHGEIVPLIIRSTGHDILQSKFLRRGFPMEGPKAVMDGAKTELISSAAAPTYKFVLTKRPSGEDNFGGVSRQKDGDHL